MKLGRDSTPVQRRSSFRSQPYDLRRRVLVKNFLNDQPPKISDRPPTPRIPYQLQSVQKPEDSSSSDKLIQSKEKTEQKYASELSSSGKDVSDCTRLQGGNGEDFLLLFSRRLRSSETSRLRQPCRKIRYSAVPCQSKMRLAESQEKLLCRSVSTITKDFVKSPKRSSKPVPKLRISANQVRSVPSFIQLNEIVSCDSATYKKTIEAIRSSAIRTTLTKAPSEIANKSVSSSPTRTTLTKALSEIATKSVSASPTRITLTKAPSEIANKSVNSSPTRTTLRNPTPEVANEIKPQSSLRKSLSKILRRRTSSIFPSSQARSKPEDTNTTPEMPNKVKRSLSLRKSFSKILRRKTSDIFPAAQAPSTPADTKTNKKQPFVARLFSPFSSRNVGTESPNWVEEARPTAIRRTTSFRTPPTPAAPRLKRRAHSVRLRCVKLSNDAF